MRPNFACGVSLPFLTLPPILTVGGQEVGGPWVVPGVFLLGEKNICFPSQRPKNSKTGGPRGEPHTPTTRRPNLGCSNYTSRPTLGSIFMANTAGYGGLWG